MSLVLKNVSKSFVGKQAVDNVSFSLEKPGVYGLLGTNGAGKTTTIRMLLGIIKKDSGEITWKGKPVDRKNLRIIGLWDIFHITTKFKKKLSKANLFILNFWTNIIT